MENLLHDHTWKYEKKTQPNTEMQIYNGSYFLLNCDK